MGKGNAKHLDEGRADEVKIVTLVAYDRAGTEIRRLENFRMGADSVGHALSMVMGAALFVDPSSGEVVRRWNPWGVLG